MSILGLFKKKKTPIRENGSSMIAMVAVSSENLPDAIKLNDFISVHWPDSPLINDASANGQTLTFNIGGAIAAVSLMPVPIPWEEIKGPCATAWYWPEATTIMKRHKFHLIVALMKSPFDKVGTALLLTKLVAAVASLVDADGIYLGAGTLVHSTENFIEQAKEMSLEFLPLYLWIDFRVQKEANDKYTLFTTGLVSLGLMEIEILNSEHKPPELIDKAFNIGHYLLDKGPILKDGDTIGVSVNEKIFIRHLPSIWDSNKEVYRLAF